MNNQKIKSLYIHIPFCDHICVYCDFYKMISKEEEKEKYVNYLLKELEIKKDLLNDIETIYLGGGTPSNLNHNLLDKLLLGLSKYINFNNLKEFTIECNPVDVNQKLIDIIIKYNINRISLGVQSFNDLKLKYLKRNHTQKIILNAINLLHSNNLFNINCDLIYGLEIKNDFIDNLDVIKNDLDFIIKYNIPHISCYTLIVEDKTILNKFIKEMKYKPLDDDLEADLFDFINKYLKEFNYNHYEISNYAKEGFCSIHNLRYWNNEYYLGLGANASYYYDNTRFTNINNLKKYYYGIDNLNLEYLEKIKLDKEDQMYEEVMLGLRKLEGINKNNFLKKYNCDIINVYKGIIPLIKQGILIDDGENIKVKEDKIYILNDILLSIL